MPGYQDDPTLRFAHCALLSHCRRRLAGRKTSMRYGIHIHNFGDYSDPRDLAELAQEAEAAGWDGVFVCDHLTARGPSGPEPVANPWIALAAMAVATRRVRIGPLVTPLSRRRPWQLASETVSLDQLS